MSNMSKKEKRIETLKTKKPSKQLRKSKRFLIRLISSIGIISLSSAIISTSLAFTNKSHIATSAQPIDELATKQSFLYDGKPLVFNLNDTSTLQNGVLISKSNFDSLTPMYFYNNYDGIGNNASVLQALNNLDLPFLTNGLSSNLVISAYQVTNANTITPETSSVSFNAIYVTNPNANSKITLSFSGGYVVLRQNQGVWLYGMDGSLHYCLNSNSSSFNNQTNKNLTPILQLNNLYNTFTSTGTSPTLPPSTYLQQAQKQLLTNYKSIFTADFEALLNYLNNTSTIKVNALNTTAYISFSELETNLNDLVFSVVDDVPQVTIPYLKATMTINVPSADLDLTLKLDQPSTTFPLVAFVAYEEKGDASLQTAPAITNENLNNVTFANTGSVASSGVDPAFCYYLDNNTPLVLYVAKTNAPFTMEKVSFNFLWTMVWMLKHPTKISYDGKTVQTNLSYGSVYDGGNISIAPTKTSIPISWNNVATVTIKNDPVLISDSQYDDFISYSSLNTDASANASNDSKSSSGTSSSTTSSFVVSADSSNSTLANLFNTIKQSNSQLLALPSYINYSFLVTVTTSNNEVSVLVKEINFYNNTKPTNSTSDVTTITINDVCYPIYNTYGTNFVSASVSVNENFSLIVSKNANVGSLILPTNNSTSIPSSLSNLYLYAGLFNEIVSNSKNSDYSAINNAFLQEATQWLTLNNDLEVSAVGFSSGGSTSSSSSPDINSITITNTTKEIQTFTHDGIAYTILPNSSYTYNLPTPITITGFCSISQIANSFNLSSWDNGYYNELMAGNFSANSNTNTNSRHNNTILQFLNSLIDLSKQNATIIAYTSTSTASNATTLTLTSLTIENKGPAFYLDASSSSGKPDYILVKSGANTITTNFSLTGLASVLASATLQTLNNYLAQCKTYLAGLSSSKLQALISAVSSVDGIEQEGTMPSPTSLTYSNFSISISNYNTSSLTFDINDFNWDISGKALDIPFLGSYPINTGIALKDQNIPVQLVPMVYYINKTTKEVCSYPSVVTTATDTFSEAGISKKVGISTVLDYSLDGINLSDITDARMGFFLKYVNAEPNQTSYYGDGLALPTVAGADHSAEPYLNFSYAVNSFLMEKDSTTYGISGTSFKSFTPNVANVFVYGSSKQTYTSSQIAKLDLTNGYNVLTFINAFYSQDFTNTFNTSLALNNPYLQLTSYSVVANELTGFYIKNTSHITYLFEDETSNGASAIYLMPENTTYVPITAISYSVSNIGTATVDLSSQKDSNSYTHSLFKAVRYLADDYGYLYPLLWTQDNDNCLSYSTWGFDYYWNQGSSPITINLQTWKAYISTGPIGDDRTINMNMIGGSIFNTNNSTLANALSSYTAYTNGTDIYFTSLTLDGVVLSGLNITLSPGDHFRLA